MPTTRRYLLGFVLGLIALLTAYILRGVLATTFFAITIAYVLVPLARWLRRRGYSPWAASALSTGAALLGTVFLFLPIVGVLYVRRRQIVELLGSLPDRIVLEFAGFVFALDASEVTTFLSTYLRSVAIELAALAPVLAAKLVVFVFVVFALLFRDEAVRVALLAPLPAEHHDVAFAFHERIRRTLSALYVTQAATGLATSVIAAPLFWALGYEYAFTLALVAGILQFLPVVGPSVVVLGLGGFELVRGAYVAAALVLVLGLLLVAVLPDAVLRPRLARETANLPASLYFVGFTGGVLSLGPVGIIAGPLVVALLVEALSLLADEMNHREIDPGA